METFLGILIPFLGTTLGAACVFFMKKSLSDLVRRSLAGFAAGVMVAASIWSLLIPAIEQSELQHFLINLDMRHFGFSKMTVNKIACRKR